MYKEAEEHRRRSSNRSNEHTRVSYRGRRSRVHFQLDKEDDEEKRRNITVAFSVRTHKEEIFLVFI